MRFVSILFLAFLTQSICSQQIEQKRRRGEPRCLGSLRILGTSPTAITLAWNYTCDDADRVNFKVYYAHRVFLACASGQRDIDRGTGTGNSETRETVIVLDGLNPNSEYELTVKALRPSTGARRRNQPQIPEERRTLAETLVDLPLVKPASSNLPIRATKKTLKFYWRAPVPSQCERFNGRLEGVFYTLKGIDLWNLDEKYNGSTTDIAKEFSGLQPYSNYVLFVYAKMEDGRINRNIYLKMEARTKEDMPYAPRDLEDNSNGADKTNRMFQWLPPYPPTGEIKFYRLRWKDANSTQWLDREDVYPSDDLCAVENGQTVCHVVRGLDPELRYKFQLSAWNEGVAEHSSWTQEVISEASEATIGLLGLTKSSLLVVLIASGVGVLLILLAAICISYQCHKRREKTRYKNVPIYERGGLNASMLTERTDVPSRMSRQSSNNSNQDTMKRYQLHLLPIDERSRPVSIQEQPLPEVPPEEHLYEELRLKNQPMPKTNVNRKFSAGLETDEEEFLKPTGGDESEDDYLPPRRLSAAAVSKSSDTIDVDDYLKPTFGRFDRIDSRDLSPPSEAPPPIPTVSYEPVERK